MPEKICPVCGKPASPRETPFCSRHCADVDLGRWLTGTYILPGEPASSEQTGKDQPDQPS
jgi:uncharacterized protein